MADWTGHILRRNCLLKHVTEGKKWREDEKEDISTEGKENILELERGSTSSQSVEKSQDRLHSQRQR